MTSTQLPTIRQRPPADSSNGTTNGAQDTTTFPDTSVEDAPQILDMLCSHLSRSALERAKAAVRRRTTSEASAFASADFALFGIWKMHAAFETNRALDAIILHSWPSILAWMQLYVGVAKKDLSSTEEKRRIVALLARALGAATQDLDLFRAVTSAQDARKLIVELWLTEDTKPFGGFPSASWMLLRLLDTSKDRDSDFNLVLAETGGKPSRMADIALSRLYDTIKQEPRDIPAVSVHVHLLTALSPTTQNPLAPFAFKRGIYSHLTRLIFETSHLPLELGSSALDMIETSFLILAYYQRPGSGNRWILQSLQSGLLPAILNCSQAFALFAAPNVLCVKNFLGTLLPSYLVYSTVLDAVASAWKGVTNIMEDKVRGSMVAKEWKTFKDIFLERMVLKCSYDRVRDETSLKLRCMTVSCCFR